MLYNKYGIEILEIDDLIILIDSKIIYSKKKIRDINKKLNRKKDFKLQAEVDFQNGYLAALEFLKKESSRKDWRIGVDFEFGDTPKGQLFKCIDADIIPELDKENLDIIYYFKGKINDIFNY